MGNTATPTASSFAPVKVKYDASWFLTKRNEYVRVFKAIFSRGNDVIVLTHWPQDNEISAFTALGITWPPKPQIAAPVSSNSGVNFEVQA